MLWSDVEREQKELCARLNLVWTPVDPQLMIAFNHSIFSSEQPLNGLRHPKNENINGWYLWAGTDIPQERDDFFKPIHAIHLLEKQTLVLKYLGLPYGYRFQIDDKGYEDIWFDNSILKIE